MNTNQEKIAIQLTQNFMQNYSQKLRSPISSIRGLVEIAKCYPNHKETSKCLEIMEECTHKIDLLISSFEDSMLLLNKQISSESNDTQESLKILKTILGMQRSDLSVS